MRDINDMLNRFKNVLYGPPSGNNEICDSSNDSLDQNSNGPSKKEIQSNQDGSGEGKTRNRLLKKSASFREAFLSNSHRSNNNNDTVNGYGQNDKSYPINGSIHDNDSQYSAMLRIVDHKVIKTPKFPYSRPEFLQLKTEDEILVSADHQIRPIILPRDASKLPWRSGYAECINSGKSIRNEDQAACYQNVIVKKSNLQEKGSDNSDSVTIDRQLPWVYFGIFDGHAGPAVAVAAATQLHCIIEEKLQDLLDILIRIEFDSKDENKHDDDDDDDDLVEFIDCDDDRASEKETTFDDQSNQNGNTVSGKNSTILKDAVQEHNDHNNKTTKQIQEQAHDIPESSSASIVPVQQLSNAINIEASKASKRERKTPLASEQQYSHNELLMIDVCRNNITVDSLITGALESAFWQMDLMIARDKQHYRMAGGCTAVVSLFILGKLYVCNAGDSRAVVYKNDKVIPMSFDFTPISEKERIMRIGQQHPEFLGSEFTHLEFSRRPTRRDLGKKMLYKDAHMTGWSMKTIDYDDLKLPLVWGEGKRSRVLATMGVTRGFGDHELRAHYGSLLIKPFLTPEPEVKILPLEMDETLKADDVLIMGSDGLWDVTTNHKAAEIVKGSFDLFPDNEESNFKYRYISAAQDLVIHSRGHATNWNNVWRIDDERLASLDDIAVFVIPLKQYRDEYLEWKNLRRQAKQRQA